MQLEKKVFALDIGTRSVVGIILEETDSSYKVLDLLSIEHKERAMVDGQIHDVVAVSEVINEVKKQLEQKHGSLTKVCVAAAGRALRTQTSEALINIQGKSLMTAEDILHLELSAVQQAQALAAEKQQSDKSTHYYCVGYSVLYYKLDGEEIGNLIDQQGHTAKVEIIATFLPRIVVESLLSALKRADLEMEALTLEPIAAINVLIPPSMRRLNVALVDIGAGTSDIAITESGTVTAYGMVPTAGDEITEALSDAFLLDFPFAEEAKRKLSKEESIVITDILGFETEITRSDLIDKISHSIDHLAQTIAEEINELNYSRSPKAVMLVGGGSQTPELPSRLAKALRLPLNRVAIRGVDAIPHISIDNETSMGPELVTPIGIAIAAKKSPVQYVTTYVNGQPVRLFEVNTLSVGDCLLAAGIKINKLYGKPGIAMIVNVNGQEVTIPGQYGKAPLILKNGKPCSFDEHVANEDELIVEKGLDGAAASLTVGDLIDFAQPKTIYIDDKPIQLPTTVLKNGEVVDKFTSVSDRDKISIEELSTLREIFNFYENKAWRTSLHPFRVSLNGKETFFPIYSGKVTVNGQEVKSSYSPQQGDRIISVPGPEVTWQEIAKKKHLLIQKSIIVTYNGQEIQLDKKQLEAYKNGEEILADSIIQNGDSILYKLIGTSDFIFQDLFRHIEVDMPPNAGGKFQLLRNGEITTFYDPIHAGDSLEIQWPLAKEKS
ncbi:cell division protein FtsA [Bacillus sp. 2205SS5-2]|uniref:cell division protein FtsA n=1 Tax=Bacillus sp. 2205SS5-2 TaxID=3109031 RepID=UPI0030077CF8